MSSSIKKWNGTQVTLIPNQIYVHNFMIETANILQVENRKAVNGGTVFADTESNVSSESYIMRVEQGCGQMLVRPYQLRTVYLWTTSPEPLRVTLTEIESDELNFAYNSAQTVDIQGNVQVQEPITIDGTVSIAGNVEIQNDSGNPIPVSGTVGVNNFPATQAVSGTVGVNALPALPAGTNNIGDVDVLTLPKVQKSGYSYQEVVAGAGGDITVKAGAGEVVSITSDGVAKVRLKDGVNNVWKQITGETHFPEPVTHGTSIILNFDVAGTAYIIYK